MLTLWVCNVDLNRFNSNPQTVNKYHADCPLHVYSTRAFLLCDIMDQHTTQGKLSAQTKLRSSAPVCSGSLKIERVLGAGHE